ncbi:zinc-binding dehydrogenase [Limosilactobacillus mucosae]
MKTAIFAEPGKMVIKEVAKPTLQADDDVIIRVIRTCVCGSDLWSYSQGDAKEKNSINGGHEALGIVEEVGSAITTVKSGDFVIAPFTHGCGHCQACLAGYDGTCDEHQGYSNWSIGFQSEYIRFTYGNWALVKIPGQPADYSEGMMKSFMTLADVMATGYHAARTADVKHGDRVVVVGDGAVGQCAVIAAKMMGASQVVIMSRHEDRQKLAQEFGATAYVAERGEEGAQKVKELLGGGADAALDCVGSEASINQCLAVVHNGGHVSRIGVPHGNVDPFTLFARNIALTGGSASVTTYDKNVLLKAVLDGQINPGKVFTKTYTLDQINEAYQDMADRKTIKSYIVIG